MLIYLSERKCTAAFVIDTNVLVDFPDIIPNGADTIPEDPSVDISGALLIVPTAVVRELSKFKGELSGRGVAARKVLNRLREIVEGAGLSLKDGYNLERTVLVDGHDVCLSVLPVSEDFRAECVFRPSPDDMDGQIILTAMYAGQELPSEMPLRLLSNDNGLAVRAAPRGVATRRYGYKRPEPNIGRRKLTVPFNLYHRWDKDQAIPLSVWEECLPQEPPLEPNEFVEMVPVGWQERIVRFRNVGRYDLPRNAIVSLQYAWDFPGTIAHAGHAMYAEALYHPDIRAIVASGPAGTGKTYMPTVFGYEASRAGLYMGVMLVVRVFDDGVGFLPGNLDEKLDPNAQPIKNALQEYFMRGSDSAREKKPRKRQCATAGMDEMSEGATGKLPEKSPMRGFEAKTDIAYYNWFRNVAITHTKGRSFARQVIIVDEVQDFTNQQADTAVTRMSHDSKIIFTGSIEQIHAKYLDEYNNGLAYVLRMLDGDEEVARVPFLPDENMRDPLVKRITERQEAMRRARRARY